MSGGSVMVGTASFPEASGGSNPTSPLQRMEMCPVPGLTSRGALHELQVRPVPMMVANRIIVRKHYLHSMPVGTQLSFGVFLDVEMVGALTLGVGSYNSSSLVRGASPDDCLTLSRFWLAEDMPANSESRILGVVSRALRRHTKLKFLLSYADPTQGHIGTIYQAAGWHYTGLSDATPHYDLGDGRSHHSRSLSHAYGTHSVEYFARQGIELKRVPQSPKHRYIHFLDPGWREQLKVPVLPYPKRIIDESN